MITIFKQQLEIIDSQIINVPTNSEILTAQIQNEKICIWFKLDTDIKTKEGRVIKIIGTGNPILETFDTKLKYISTVQFVKLNLVFHIFERLLK